MKRHLHTFILFIILITALLARFRYLTQIEHNVDHAYTVWQAMSTLDRGEFPLVGQGTSVLFANPPLTGYLFIPAVALTRSPLGVYVFVVALNTLAVWMCYRAASSLIGKRLALIAAALMAVNPWVIEYSRTSWVQSLLPFFVCAVAWLLFPVLMRQSRRPIRRTALALTMLALTMQTYLLAYFLLVPVGLLLLIFRKRVPLRGILIGGAVILLTTLLYGIGLMQQWDSVQQRLDDFTTGDSRINSEAWDAAVRLVTGAEYELARGLDAPINDSAQRHDLSQIAHYTLLALLLVGIGTASVVGATYMASEGKRTRYIASLQNHQTGFSGRGMARHAPTDESYLKHRDTALILLVWFFLPILAMSYTSKPVHTFYQLLGVPAGYILAAWGIGLVFRPQVWRWSAIVVTAAWIPFAALMLTNSARYYQETAAVPGAHQLYALPVEVGLKLGDAINAALPENGIVYALAEEWIVNSFAGRLFPSVPDVRPAAFNFVPRDGGVVVQISPEDAPLPAFATRTESISLSDGKTITIDALPPAAQIEMPGTRLNIPSQQGLTLVGYELCPGNATVGTRHAVSDYELITLWRVDSIAPEVYERIFAPFLHVFDADGEQVLNLNGEGLAGYLWRVGDLHVHRMRFTLPDDQPAPFTLRVGQYDGLHNANIIFTPPDAEPDVVIRLPEIVE